jgi:hypothetical protein
MLLFHSAGGNTDESQEPYGWDSVVHVTRAATAVRYGLLSVPYHSPICTRYCVPLYSTRSSKNASLYSTSPVFTLFLNSRKSPGRSRYTARFMFTEATSWSLVLALKLHFCFRWIPPCMTSTSTQKLFFLPRLRETGFLPGRRQVIRW